MRSKLFAQCCFLVGLFFLSGCTQAKPLVLEDVSVAPEKTEQEQPMHVTGPWDAGLYLQALKKGEDIRPRLQTTVKGGFVPHHLMSAHTAGAFFQEVAQQDPGTIVLISPNHFFRGAGEIQISPLGWKTPFGEVPVAAEVFEALAALDEVEVTPASFDEEHGIYGVLPFIAQTMPEAAVVPVLIKPGTDAQALDALVETLAVALPEDAVIVGSVDFSHYMRLPVANFHDALSKAVIEAGDAQRAFDLEVDSPETVYTVLQLMKHYGTQRVAHAHHTNSATIVPAPAQELTTSHYVPYFVAGEPKQNKTATVLHVGDLMLDRSVAFHIKEQGASWLFETLAGEEERFFSGVDVILANLEGAVTAQRIETSKEIAFRFDPELLPVLKETGFSMVTLANNHTLDMGRAGFEETKGHLQNAGIAFFGQQYGMADESAIIRQVGDARMAFVGLNDTNVRVDDVAAIELVAALEDRADYTLVSIHWGLEYQPLSHPRQRLLAQRLIDAGADAIVGHHPHVVQEMEVYNGAPIFYSLGNFVFDQYFSTQTQRSLAVGLVFAPEKTEAYVFPLQSIQSQPSQLPYSAALEAWRDLLLRSRMGESMVNDFHIVIHK